MKTLKETIKYLCLFGIMAFCIYFGYESGKVAWKYPEPFEPPLPSLIEVQHRIGAKPDGIYGRETETKWDEYCANQYAAEYFTASGGPKEN